MTVRHGLIRFLEDDVENYRGLRLGLVSNSTSVDYTCEHTMHRLLAHPAATLTAVFGPQHGLFGHTQDNMVEWHSYRDPASGLPIFSLYGETRIPTEEMMENVDAMVFDIQDVGARYYTFIYTMAYAMKACSRDNKKMIVLDRPNPITGVHVEGSTIKSGYTSFVGMYPILNRHGMTCGELARMFRSEFGIQCDLDVIPLEGWNRTMWADETGVPWVMPSPNMPTLDTATVYPGMCLIEGTNLSEGRGTTRPFEIMGAPFIEPRKLLKRLVDYRLPGVRFRELMFRPTFQKFKGEACGGVQVHVTDRNVFEPVLVAVAILKAVRELYPKQFQWKLPPYEYEYVKLPFDILAGSSDLRREIETGVELVDIKARWAKEEKEFLRIREPYLLYE
ncbi:MAG TPA: DUF1343 domain-containing protein [bacterium]|nr:DUF1343 domain-containing protein [bacterium]